MKLLCVIACVVSLANISIDAAKILAYFPFPSISHQLPFRPLTQELARRGHELVIITTDPAFPKGEGPANITEIDIHDISYDSLAKHFMSTPRGSKKGFKDQLEDIIDLLSYIVDLQLNITEVKNAIYGQKYDLLLLESCMRPALALSHVHRVPVILTSSFGSFLGTKEAIGAPVHPILYPSPIRQRLYNLTLWEKVDELYLHFKTTYLFYKAEESENKMMRKHFGNDIPPISELYNNVDMVFLNIHPIFEGNHPVPPGMIYMWGIHKKPEKEIPKDLNTFLDNSKHGVIYMSFGTNTDPTLLPPERIELLVKVFCQLPYDVLWKWNKDELPGRCKNIKIGKWFPQSDLLRHPKVKLFVTQGGLQSTDEAIKAGVPLIGIPMLGDQWYNVEKYVQFGIGLQLDLDTLTQDKFKDAVETVIDDNSFRMNIKKLDALMRDEPMPALEKSVWWVEHVLRHGGAKHLRSPAANISWAQYLELELVLTALFGLVIVLSLGCATIYYVYKFLIRLFSANVKIKSN